MPTYVYRCTKCRKRFTIVQSIGEHGKRKIKCPKCKSTKVEQLIQPFFAITSKKS